MFRRLATVACAVALVVALCVAATHDHGAAQQSGTSHAEACLYCSGGATAAAAPQILPPVQRMWTLAAQVQQAAPELKRQVSLAHSGNAPPA